MDKKLKKFQLNSGLPVFKTPKDLENESDSTLDPSNRSESPEFSKKNCNRKSTEQIEILKREFEKNRYWNNDKVKELASLIKLSKVQIYKWHWDRKHKGLYFKEDKLRCSEILYPVSLEFQLVILQKAYYQNLNKLKELKRIILN